VFGATLIVRALDWNNPAALALYLVLTAAGIWFQAFLRNGRSRIPRKK
jgi:hypothetical protein